MGDIEERSGGKYSNQLLDAMKGMKNFNKQSKNERNVDLACSAPGTKMTSMTRLQDASRYSAKSDSHFNYNKTCGSRSEEILNIGNQGACQNEVNFYNC